MEMTKGTIRMVTRATALGVMMWALVPGTAAAQTPAPQSSNFLRQVDISGSVDAYYTYNFNTPHEECASAQGVAIFNCFRTSDVAHNAFSLSLAQISFAKKATADSRSGFHVDLGFGPTATIASENEPGGSAVYQHIGQAYVSYLAPVGNGLQLDFGKFNTPVGAESVRSQDNWNYSRSLNFALAIPRNHSGLRATYAFNDTVAVTGLLVNGWNNVVDNNSGKSIGGQITLTPTAGFKLSTAYIGGPETDDSNKNWRHLWDTVATYQVTPTVSLAANYDYGTDTQGTKTVKWQGISGSLRLQPTDWFAFTPRVEYYNDADGYTTGVVQSIKATTLTLEFKHKDGVLTRIEYRGDFSDHPYFFKNFTEVSNQNTLTVGVVYGFSSK